MEAELSPKGGTPHWKKGRTPFSEEEASDELIIIHIPHLPALPAGRRYITRGKRAKLEKEGRCI